ncbi:B3 domain-containing transcription factor [Actinidia chinensis var. chinensis]|uniref:B3 domain-containing transcription factor n=1 Tax=Actinidia chinensis var. chinensis TaxID=1590841 RepID=A0A2R6RZB1_ACTCC|nr:B3 domain-containing transcription factor [Actinidia chinensis var. chinensis]
MIVPKKSAEAYLPALFEKEGFFISMDDMDGLHVWSFKFRYWPNNTSRMYVLENTGDFVNTHGLKQGDYMMLYQDYQNQNYVIRARKASDQDSYTDSAVDDYVPDEFEVNDCDQVVPMNFSAVDGTEMPFVYETTFSSDSETSYVYETTFSNDSLFDFWSGPMTYSSKVEPIGSFESIENLSMEELLLSF